jgi:small subunit ribosomal protein S7
LLPDPLYQDVQVTRFINNLMREGKKSVVEGIFYQAMEMVQKQAQEEPLKVFKKAIKNAEPSLEVKSRRVGGANYQVPVEVRPRRREALAMRWLISFARARGEHTMQEKLAGELVDAANNRGATVKKREDVHRMAEANKAFAHYRW